MMLSENEKKQKQDRNVPQLRFAGFTGEWEQRKLGDLYKRNSERNEKQFSETKTISIATMHFNKNGNGASEDSLLNYKVLRIGDIAYEGHTNKQFAFGRFVLNDIGDGIMSPRFMTLRPIKKMDTDFWKHYIHYEPLMRRILVKSTKAGTMMNELVVPEFLNEEILIPKKEEQAKIGVFFKKLEHLIILQQCKLDLLKQKKKGYLQKMFPKENENVPELRFSGYADAWEQRKLGEIGKTFSGIGFPENEQGGTEGIPFFKVSDMNNVGNEHEMNSANNYVSNNQLKRKKWKVINNVPGVIFAKVGAAIMLNRKRLVRVPFLIDNNTMEYAFDDSWDTYFGQTLFETINLPRYAQVGALPSYNGSDIETISIEVPNKNEQERIGSFFKRLDHLITLHQRKLDMLKERKKAYLQKMFI